MSGYEEKTKRAYQKWKINRPLMGKAKELIGNEYIENLIADLEGLHDEIIYLRNELEEAQEKITELEQKN